MRRHQLQWPRWQALLLWQLLLLLLRWPWRQWLLLLLPELLVTTGSRWRLLPLLRWRWRQWLYLLLLPELLLLALIGWWWRLLPLLRWLWLWRQRLLLLLQLLLLRRLLPEVLLLLRWPWRQWLLLLQEDEILLKGGMPCSAPHGRCCALLVTAAHMRAAEGRAARLPP